MEIVDPLKEAAREHWSVENGLHWRLDVIFRQDKSCYRNRIGARNFAVVRKIALNALSRDISIKGRMATKQFATCCNPTYRSEILKNCSNFLCPGRLMLDTCIKVSFMLE